MKKIIGKNILVAPMDWGLGHAARCSIIIKKLVANNNVIIACGKSAMPLLKKEFPNLTIILIKDRPIPYPKEKITFFTILHWIPILIFNTINEHYTAKKIIKKHKIDTIISDNRYGLLFKRIDCIFITHQLQPIAPKPFKWLQPIVNFGLKNYLSKFSQVLIPDTISGFSLSGKLAGDLINEKKNYYPKFFFKIGILSRFSTQCPQPQKHKYEWLLLLSGQENQRSIFEKLLIKKFSKTNSKILLIRGTNNGYQLTDFKNIDIINIADTNTIFNAISQSKNIICRSGYSTICDLYALNRGAIIVPTPGQTEQEYLAAHLDGKFSFKAAKQKDFE